MSSEDNNAGKEQVPAGEGPGSPLIKKLEEAIGSWAEATTAGDAEAAHAAAMEALALAAEEQLRNPKPNVLLQDKADELESKGEWGQAEAVRREVLAVEESSGNFGLIAKAQMDLGRLLLQVGRREEAGQWAGAATVSARRLKLVPFLVMVLLNEARCALTLEDSGRALAAAEEAVQIIAPGKLQDNMRARALTTRARCRLAIDDATGAGADLDSAGNLLPANSAFVSMPGPNWTLANWWEVKSRLEQQGGNDFRAREAITLAIEHYRQSEGPHGLLALARALEMLGEICGTAGDLAAAEEALQEAKSIREGLRFPGD